MFSESIVTIVDTIQFFPKHRTCLGFSRVKYNALTHTVNSILTHLSSINRHTTCSGKRGASFNSGDFNTKSARSEKTLDDASTGLSGIYTLTDPVRLEGVYWCNPIYRGCSICRRKVDTKYSDQYSQAVKHFGLTTWVKWRGDVLSWLTAFDEIAADILGTPASEYDSLDVSGWRKLVDSVVGLHFLVNVKTVKSGFTNFAFAKINPARTVCPPYNAVVRVHDVIARYKWGALYQCVVAFAARGN